MVFGFDKKDLKKGLGVLAEKSKDIAKMTVEAGKKGSALANEKIEEYSQRSQRAEKSNVSSSEMKKYERYAQNIINNVDDDIISRIFKNIVFIEFALAHDYIISYIESYDEATEFEQSIFKFIEDKWDPLEEEIKKEESYLIELYKKIINDSSSGFQKLMKIEVNRTEYLLISQAVLDITGKWKYNLEYKNKGSYLVKKISRDTANFVVDIAMSNVKSAVKEAERKNRRVGRCLEDLNDEQLESYYNNQAIIEEKNSEIEYYEETKKQGNIIMPRLMELSVEELAKLQINAGI